MNETVPVDALKLHYKEISEKAIDDSEIREFALEMIMEIFMKGIRQKLIKGECLSILIKAQTTKGKSSLGFFLMLLINKIIKSLKRETSYKGEDNAFELISANQIEFTRIARRADLYNVCTTIDEYSHLAETGAQSTIEEKLFKWRANVCAQKFIHTIMCTPTSEYDTHGLIIMEIIDKDEQNKTTLCRLFYNDPTSHQPTYLGNLMFDISEILDKKWYKLYRIKKFFSIELAEKDLIRDVRELEESMVVLLTYIKCLDLAKVGHSDKNLTKCRVRDTAREVGAVYSIVGEEIVYKWAQSLLDLVVTKSHLKKGLTKKRRNPLTPEQEQEIIEQIKIYDEHIEKEYSKYLNLTKLYAKYMSIGNNAIGKSIVETCRRYGVELGDLNTREDLKRLCKKYNLENPEEEKENEHR